ncbi:cerebellar degeneration-related protein 2-like isoform X2 [Lethenteron reissneri]|uniref:cerebellar degeneration-related protein 2-like isoform X2 n=1 Tax=Lethenteron reissneri TaxID=7753 RepID=UPI002AB6AE1A|nr:cerebellar degeneration-related protein 2-like isoform X2 [Lethenteron reissneri]
MEEYEIVEDEPWYDHRDLEQDLQLAAELGKTLLERNTELEETLQQLYAANQEQAQELESRQAELLRQVNEQHARVYEQLDNASRDLETDNQRLLLENKAGQHRVERLTATVQDLQDQVEQLQQQRLEELSVARGRRAHPAKVHPRDARDLTSTPRPSCSTRRSASCGALPDRSVSPRHDRHDHHLHLLPPPPPPSPPRPRDLASELALERRRRLAAESTLESAARDSGAALAALADELAAARDGAAALEAELRELRGRDSSGHQSDGAAAAGGGRRRRRRSPTRDADLLVAAAKHVPESDDGDDGGRRGAASTPGGTGDGGGDASPRLGVRKSSSETALDAIGGDGGRAPRGGGLGLGGMSILSEVDERYHALLERHDELLARQRRPSFVAALRAGRSANAAVQTSAEGDGGGDDGGGGGGVKLQRRLSQHQPEYKALFEEIFLRIQRSRAADDTDT